MKTSALFLALAPAAFAHTIFTNLHINGKDQGETTAVRYRKSSSNYPLEDVTSKDMACNVGGDSGAKGLLTVPQGAELTFEFKASLINPDKPKLEPGHKGPCAVYLKKVDSAESAVASGDGWFKVWDEGYDSEAGQWCTTKYTPTGKFTINLPKGLQPGEYLAKPELLALHNAHEGRPQFFTSCMQIKIEGSGDLVPESTVSIPGYVKASDESVNFNIYSGKSMSNYPMPGPSVAKLVSSGGSDNGSNEEVGKENTPSPSVSAAVPGITQAPECKPVTETKISTKTERVTVYADRRYNTYARRHGVWV